MLKSSIIKNTPITIKEKITISKLYFLQNLFFFDFLLLFLLFISILYVIYKYYFFIKTHQSNFFKMKIISWNVNGIRAAVKKGFLEWFKIENPDILCIQESKANEDQLSSEILESHGYFNYWHSGIKKGYSGVATFSKEEPLYVQKGLGYEKFDKEGRVLISEHENFLLYNIYFPNGQKDDVRLNYKLDFYDTLLPIINEQVESGIMSL